MFWALWHFVEAEYHYLNLSIRKWHKWVKKAHNVHRPSGDLIPEDYIQWHITYYVLHFLLLLGAALFVNFTQCKESIVNGHG